MRTSAIRLPSAALLALAAALALPSHAAGRVSVDFVDPEHYADTGFGSAERARKLEILQQHLQGLGQRLADGRTLALDVLDVDLAGDVPIGTAHPIRVLRGGADWPRMTLRYTLRDADGRVVASGQERIADLDYLARPGPSPGGELGHEKRMLSDWFDRTFAAR